MGVPLQPGSGKLTHTLVRACASFCVGGHIGVCAPTGKSPGPVLSPGKGRVQVQVRVRPMIRDESGRTAVTNDDTNVTLVSS